jgi:hypothetical protein
MSYNDSDYISKILLKYAEGNINFKSVCSSQGGREGLSPKSFRFEQLLGFIYHFKMYQVSNLKQFVNIPPSRMNER